MNILHIAPIGKHREGIGTVLVRLVPELIRLGHDVKVISIFPNCVYRTEELEVLDSSCFGMLVSHWKPDVAVFHSLYHFSYLRLSSALEKNGIPFMIQMHGILSVQNYQKSKLKKMLANWLFFNNLLKKASRLIFLNEDEYNNCVVNQVNPHHVIIPNGCEYVDDLMIKTSVNDPLRVVYLGRICKHHKGLDILVNALNILCRRGINEFKMDFYGNESDPDVEWLKNELRNMGGVASYNGSIYGSDKDRMLRSTDFFVLTSRYEGMPMAVLEALSYGLPCLVTPGTNMSRVVTEAAAGWKCEFSAEAVADTLHLACQEYKKEYRNMSSHAYKLAKKFSWNNIAKLYAASCQQIIKE